MQEIESIKNYFIKSYGKNIAKYLKESKFNDLRFIKYYMMENINFYFSKNINDNHIYKETIYLEPIFLKNIFFYYKRYLTKNEIEFLCNNVDEMIYVYIVDQPFPEKDSINYNHIINRIRFMLPLFFHSTTYEFYCNARCKYKIDSKIISTIKNFNKLSFNKRQKILINEDFNIFTLGLENNIKFNFSKNKEYIFDNNYHYYFFGMKVIDYPIILNEWIDNMDIIENIYYIILYVTKLKLNPEFYNINEEFIKIIKSKWNNTINKLDNKQIKFLKDKTNYNKNFLLKLL